MFDLHTVSGNNYKLTDKSDTSHYSQSYGWFYKTFGHCYIQTSQFLLNCNKLDDCNNTMERHHGLWTEYLFNFLIHIKKIEIFPNDTVERIQKWMVCHYKRYSILTFILPISFFDVNPYLRIYHFLGYFLFKNHVLIFSLFHSKLLLLEHSLLMRSIWLKTMEHLVWFR